MHNLSEAQRHINSISRPSGYNSYAWNVTKKIALEAWDCYIEGRRFSRPINYLCKEFYHVITTPEGQSIVPVKGIKRY